MRNWKLNKIQLRSWKRAICFPIFSHYVYFSSLRVSTRLEILISFRSVVCLMRVPIFHFDYVTPRFGTTGGSLHRSRARPYISYLTNRSYLLFAGMLQVLTPLKIWVTHREDRFYVSINFCRCSIYRLFTSWRECSCGKNYDSRVFQNTHAFCINGLLSPINYCIFLYKWNFFHYRDIWF